MTMSAGEIFIRRLAENGVDYLFANGGTDFAPIVEALAKAQVEGFAVPQTLIIPHETAAVGMAHGYYQATGRVQAVMVHTNVGLANCVMGTINAHIDQVPILLTSGMTPVTETGPTGHRTTPINWGQDMRDQIAMVREVTKWEGVLHYPEQTAALVDRALAAAQSHPQGPVYLGLPREALCAETDIVPGPAHAVPTRIAPDKQAIETAAKLLENAERPLIISHRSGKGGAAFGLLPGFAEKHAIPVIEFWPSRLSMPRSSPMHGGYDPGEDLATADVVLVLDATVPWLPHRHKLADGVKIIQAGPDPHHLRTPIREFPVDVALAGEPSTVIAALDAAMAPRDRNVRFEAIKARHDARWAIIEAQIAKGGGEPMTAAFVSRCVADLIGDEGRVVTELGVDSAFMNFTRGDQYFAHAIAGGLGWGLTAALGVQLADRNRLTVATVGDGSYMFANPVACHQIAEALELPILTIVFNNGRWNAVARSTLDVYPDGHASRANVMPVTSLEPLPDFCKIAEASRAWTARVSNGADLPAVLRQAAEVIRTERRQALIEVRVV